MGSRGWRVRASRETGYRDTKSTASRAITFSFAIQASVSIRQYAVSLAPKQYPLNSRAVRSAAIAHYRIAQNASNSSRKYHC